jgi:YesN/AraC family two-component response regulator
MRYLTPKESVRLMLQTGDQSYLAKCDPARKQELKAVLADVQRRLQAKRQEQTEYQQLVKAAARKRQSNQLVKQQDDVHPLMRGVDQWTPGANYHQMYGVKYKYRFLKNEDDE